MVDAASPPWRLEGEAVVAFGRGGRTTGPRQCGAQSVIIAVDYAASPVGRYVELALAEPARHRARLGLSVTTMLVSSAASEAAGRRHWGFPKELGRLSWTVDGQVRVLEWEDGGVRVGATPHTRPSVPVFVPLQALQHRGEEAVAVPGHLRARASLARITVDAGPDSVFHRLGVTRWGLLLTDVRLVLGRPVSMGQARH